MWSTRVKHSIMMATVALATVAATVVTTGLSNAPAQAATPDTGTSNAYGLNVQLLGGNVVGPIPVADLGPNGESSSLQQTLPISVPGVITANTLNADTSSTNFGTASETVNATAGVEGISGLLGLSLLSPLLNVDAIDTQCTSSAAGSTGSTIVASISIGGSVLTIPNPVPPNFLLPASELGALGGLVNITLNKQVVNNRSNDPSLDGTNIQVIGLEIQLLGALNGGIKIDAAQSFCQATGSDIEAPPTVTSVTPDFGPAGGNTAVTIDGSGFVPSSTVDFGSNAATNVTYVSPTEIEATSPAATDQSSNSQVAVDVTNSFGHSSTTVSPANSFLYEVQPVLLAINPNTGPTTGGQQFTITSSTDTLAPDSVVDFGSSSSPATDVVVAPDGESLTGVTPPGAVGPVNVTVTDAGGTSAPLTYTYFTSTINVTSVVPNFGPIAGGTAVTINGDGFTGATAINWGSTVQTTGFSVNGAGTQITIPSNPAHAAGTVDVTVTTPGGTSPAVVADEFTYLAAPTIATTNGIVPNEGPVAGGTPVTITGTNFAIGDPNLVVNFGGADATNVVVVSSTEITAVSPPSPLAGNGPGPVNVTVTTSGGTSNAQTFTYIAAPTINPPPPTGNGIVPDSGPTSGGTPVTIMGTGFLTGATVHFSNPTTGPEATNVVVVSTTEITAVTPPGDAGTVNVWVTDAGGLSNPEPFTYIAPPTIGINGLNPAYGPDTGGTKVTLTGVGLTGISAVTFEQASAFVSNGSTCGNGPFFSGTSVTPVSDTDATVVTPPVTFDGPAVVCVTATGGTAPAAEEFTFEPIPGIASVNGINPDQGPTAGGTSVTITGSGFGVGDPSTAVTFGGAQATDVNVVSSTQITAVTPPSPLGGTGAGSVPVVVTDAGGTSNNNPPVTFTYVVAPTVSGISPTSGPPQGGEPVVIKGTNLCNATGVMFGNSVRHDHEHLERLHDHRRHGASRTGHGPRRRVHERWLGPLAGELHLHRSGLLDVGFRRRRVRLRRGQVLRLHGWQAAQPADRGHGRHPGPPGVLVVRSGRRRVLLR